MSYDEAELSEIKRQVDQKLWRLGLLGGHFVAWIVGSAIVATVDPPLVEIVAPAWFGLVMLHGLMVFLWDKRDRDIQAELERRAQEEGGEKLKRDRLYRLSDDGELVEVEAGEPYEDNPVTDFQR